MAFIQSITLLDRHMSELEFRPQPDDHVIACPHNQLQEMPPEIQEHMLTLLRTVLTGGELTVEMELEFGALMKAHEFPFKFPFDPSS